MLSREQFFAYPKPALVEVNVPALGGTVYIRPLTAGERDAFEVEHTAAGRKDFRARMVVASACSESGDPMFTAADLTFVSGLPAFVVDPIVLAAGDLNKVSDDDVDALRKN